MVVPGDRIHFLLHERQRALTALLVWAFSGLTDPESEERGKNFAHRLVANDEALRDALAFRRAARAMSDQELAKESPL